jgi:hypothetical protein
MSKAHEDSPVIASSNAFASLGFVVERAVDCAVVFVAELVLVASVRAISEPATGVLLDVLAHAVFVEVFAVVTVGVVEATVATWIGDREGLAAGSRHVANGDGESGRVGCMNALPGALKGASGNRNFFGKKRCCVRVDDVVEIVADVSGIEVLEESDNGAIHHERGVCDGEEQ